MAAPKVKHFAQVAENGESLKLEDPAKYAKEIKNYKGKRVFFTVGLDRKTRSSLQNGYYWGHIIDVLSNDLGYFPDEMHDVLKMKFLRYTEEPRFMVCRSTTRLDTKEFEDYCRQIRQWASIELGIYLKKPDELDF